MSLSTLNGQHIRIVVLFFFNDTATTEIYTLSLHDALPIYVQVVVGVDSVDHLRHQDRVTAEREEVVVGAHGVDLEDPAPDAEDRKSTRLNSSHANISYAVFCLKKKNDGMVDRPDEKTEYDR